MEGDCIWRAAVVMMTGIKAMVVVTVGGGSSGGGGGRSMAEVVVVSCQINMTLTT